MGVVILKGIIILIFTGLFLVLDCYAQPVKFGVALPLFDESQDNGQRELGNEILNGIKFALEQHNKNSKVKIQAVSVDTRRDPQIARQIFESFIQDKSIISAIGPVFSSQVLAVGEMADEGGLSLISPTATGDSLAESFDYVFQLNPSYRIRGELMADYALKVLNKKNIAIISENSYGHNFAKHFRNYVSKNNGKIVFEGYYDKKAQNIRPLIDSLLNVIKRNDLFINISNLNYTQQQKLMNAGARWSLLDSLINLKYDVSIYYLFGKDAKKKMDELNIKYGKLGKQQIKFIQGYVEAIYIPVSSSSEINMIVPALFSDGISEMILGTGDWNNEKVLSDNKVYIKNLIFESEYYISENTASEFQKSLKKTKYKFNKNFLFGYDAAKLVIDLILKGNTTRESMHAALKSLSNYEAVKSPISINRDGINSMLNILRYNDGIELIARYNLTK